jgi:predicted PurR-regulated permease PerM
MVERIRRAGTVCWAVCGVAAVIALLGLVAWVFRVIWPPLILAGAIVFLLNPVVTRLQARHIPRALGTGLSYVAIVGFTVLVVLLVAPLATDQYDDLAGQWPDIRTDIEDQIDEWAAQTREPDSWFPVELPTSEELEDQFLGGNASDLDGNGVVTDEERQQAFADQLDTARELLLRIFHVGLIFIIGPIIAFYLLVDLPHIRIVFRGLVPERARGDAMVLSRRLSTAIGGYFRGQLAVAIVVGAMASIGMLLIDLPFWLIVGMIAGIFNMIPLVGPWIGAVPGIIIAFTTGGGVGKAVAVAVVMAIVQQIDNHFISPMVMQRAVKLHPAVVMLALLAGGSLAGFFGLLLAVPATATLKIVCGHVWRHFVLGEPLDEIEARWEAEAVPRKGGVIEKIGDEESALPSEGQDGTSEGGTPVAGAATAATDEQPVPTT